MDDLTGNKFHTRAVKTYTFSPLVSRFKEKNRWILYNWLNTENATLSDPRHPVYKALENNTQQIERFAINRTDYQDFNFLEEKKFIVSNKEEILEIVEKKYRQWINPDSLSLILMPVNQACNFNCLYCYEDHQDKERMGRFERDALLKFLEYKKLQQLSIEYFGGEPLLNPEFILDFNGRVIKMAKRNGFGFHSSMTTNGYVLNKKLFESLIEVGVTHYQITIDGNREDHDRLRPLVGGGATFGVIYENLSAIATIDKNKYFKIGIRINYNRESASREKRLTFIRQLELDFGADKRFEVFTKAIGKWKKEDDKQEDLYCVGDEAKDIEYRYEKDLQQSGFGRGAMSLYRGGGSYACYAGRPNSLVVFPLSRLKKVRRMNVWKCTIDFKNPRNCVGHIYEDGRFEKNSNWDLWVSDSPFRKEECKECHFVLNCFSVSCPISSLSKQRISCPQKRYQEKEIIKSIINYIKVAKKR
jgi:uncharacterized protein